MANNKQLRPFVLSHIGEVCSSIGTTSQDIDEQRIHPDRNGGADAEANRISFLTPLMEQQLRYIQGILAILYPERPKEETLHEVTARKIVQRLIDSGLIQIGPDGQIVE